MAEQTLPNAAWRYLRNGRVKHVVQARYGITLEEMLKTLCGVKANRLLPRMVRWGDLPEVLAKLPECGTCRRMLDQQGN